MKSAYDKLLNSERGKQELFVQHAITNVTNLIAKLLDDHSMTQKVLADKLGVTEGRVAQIMDGTANLTLNTIAKVLGAFDCVLEVNCHDIHNTKTKPLWHLHCEEQEMSQRIEGFGFCERDWQQRIPA